MAEPTEGDFDLASLNDEEHSGHIHDDLYNGPKSRGGRGNPDFSSESA